MSTGIIVWLPIVKFCFLGFYATVPVAIKILLPVNV